MSRVFASVPGTKKSVVQSLVSVENHQSRLRLRFRYEGKRHALAVGLPDSAVNRLVAQQKATQIELDIASGNFDSTLKKYKPPKGERAATSNQVAKLFERFMIEQTKVKGLQPGSLRRYDCALKHLQKFFKEKAAETVNGADAQAFVEYLRAKVSERTVKDYVILVQSCWVWAETILPENPWPVVLKQVKPAPKQKVKPFAADEVQRILEGFRCVGVASP